MASTSTYPIFTPNGDVVSVPDTELKNAMSQGGKLAVQMHTPDGVTRFVPHDQVGELQKHGALVNSDQGMPAAPQEKEGFWHSVGSVFGLTPEQIQASTKAQQEHPIATTFERTGYGIGPAGNMIAGAIRTAPGMANKVAAEGQASIQAAEHGDIKGFLAHQIGQFGYAGATALSPVLGDSTAKAGEQFGEGNIKGGLGTTAGVVAPLLVPDAVKVVGKTSDAVMSSPLAAKVVRGTGQAVGGVAGGTVGAVAPGPLKYPAMVAGGIAGREAGLGVANAAIDRFGIGKPRSVFAPATEAPLSTTPIQDAIQKTSAVEKRTAAGADLRSKFDAMTPQEKTDALVKYHINERTDPKTGIPNRLAFDEAVAANPGKPVAMTDVDGLKHFNDKVSHAAGDELLKAKIEALKQAGVNVFRNQGDEFLGMGNSINPEELRFKLEKAREILRNREFEVIHDDGTVSTVKGADFSYGVGKNIEDADSGLHSHKAAREAAGERKRGEFRGTVTDRPQADQVDTPPAQQSKTNLTQSGNPQRSNWRKNQRVLATADPALVEKYKNEAK